MVQKYQSPVRVYKKPFELVMRAYEMRFPTCEEIPIVLETEIIEEEIDEENGVHVIDRRAKLNIDAPYLLKKLMGVEFLLFRQRNTLDKKNRVLRIGKYLMLLLVHSIYCLVCPNGDIFGFAMNPMFIDPT